MTRLAGYNLLACPGCGQVHTRPSYSSISVYTPKDVISSNTKTCASCKNQFPADEFNKVGYLSRYTEEEEAERFAWTLHSLRLGPRPASKHSKPFLLRNWLALKAMFKPEPKILEFNKPWDEYPPLI